MRILYLDDSSDDHVIFEKAVHSLDENICIHSIFTTGELIAQMNNFPHRYDYVFVDQCLRTSTGSDLIQLIEDVINGTPVYLVTGFDADSIKKLYPKLSHKICGVIDKNDLKNAIGNILRVKTRG